MRAGALLHRLEALYLRRRAGVHSPLRRLAELLDSEQRNPQRCLAWCIELGLVHRARQTLRDFGIAPSLASALQLAWLEGDFATFDRLGADPGSPARLARESQQLQNKCVALIAARSPASALAFLAAMPRRPICAPAVALRARAPEMARAWRQHWPWRLHADYLLLDANQAPGTLQRLALLNQYLARHGLAPLRLIDPDQPLCVANLAGARDRAAGPPPGPVAPVSVLIAAHNNEQHIRASVESMLRQTFAPAEIVVVDDASSDATPQRVAELSVHYPSVRLIRLAVNRGAYFARNVGLAAARTEFAAFHDADDFAHPQRLALALQPLLDDPQMHASTSRCVRLGDDGMVGEARVWPLTRWTPISLIVRREVALSRVGFFDDTRFGADSEYVARLRSVLGERHHRLVAQPLALFGQRAGSLTTAGATGFDQYARSGARIAYQEDWTERHLASLRGGASLYRSLPEDVARALAEAGSGS